jgi:hypothetical protein
LIAVVPPPSCPDWLNPQHLTVAAVSTAQVWKEPADAVLTPLRPLTVTGVKELTTPLLPAVPNC